MGRKGGEGEGWRRREVGRMTREHLCKQHMCILCERDLQCNHYLFHYFAVKKYP